MPRAPVLLVALVLLAALSGCVALPPEPSFPLATPSRPSPSTRLPEPSPLTTSPTDAATPVPASQPVLATAPPIDDVACRLETRPGPADAAPTEGDLTDWSHIFGGRMRLCVAGPRAIELEGTAWCTWTEAFDAVSDVGSLPNVAAPDGESIDGGVSLELGVTFLTRTAPFGEVNSWEGDPAAQEVVISDHGRSGILRFDVGPSIDPEHSPSALPPHEVGLMRWACLDPKPA